MTTTDPAAAPRPLRADAARNRKRIVGAARELFAERGLEVTLDDVAVRAGVGVGTVYRRFANRDELIEAVFVHHIQEVTERITTEIENAEPWDAVVLLLTAVGEFIADDRGLATMLTSVDHEASALAEAKNTVETLVLSVYSRAEEAGVLRPELVPADFFGFVCMLAAIGEATQPVVPGAWRRYLELMLDGMRADARPRVPLTVAALTDDEIEEIEKHKHMRR
ncbi:helix-turn-helix domain containing protein [Tsukamurella sp. 8F]|uniref:TetR/AcrR family transcriptional regulator n=1 Tax=unclassified Tsukamurella TaxID=2633480 RepID=UPI0023B8B5E2|nr:MULTISPECIES: TetR/AcrR family transcriptional regulator [unclassified Tsukamurella]MDF0529705.1 helix-turn-helix domain containing protein [Tsukamurella sp. 8J]MDF0585990.1 helix-turn-helix domain containing protein [Tsukamurella sp. 8F]